MRIVATVITLALLSSCGAEPAQQLRVTAASLTLKMAETQADGDPAAVLMLCDNDKCVNPLRDQSGGGFHFKNYAELYNQKVQVEGKGQKIKMALLGITMVATAAGAFLYIKSDAMRRIVGGAAEKIKELNDDSAALNKKLANKVRKNNAEGVEDVKETLAKLEVEKEKLKTSSEKLKTRDSYVTPAYWTALGISALGANALAFAPGMAEGAVWRDNKRAFADLFIHGSAVKVTKDELIDLFAILVEQVPATVDVAVQSYLFGI